MVMAVAPVLSSITNEIRRSKKIKYLFLHELNRDAHDLLPDRQFMVLPIIRCCLYALRAFTVHEAAYSPPNPFFRVLCARACLHALLPQCS